MASGAEQPTEPQSVHFDIEVPDDQTVGCYANFLSVWNGPHDFTLDFAVTGQARIAGDSLTVPTRVVARVKVPLTVAEDMLRAIAEQVSKFENAQGPIRKRGDNRPDPRFREQ
jgi:hypothetical protein